MSSTPTITAVHAATIRAALPAPVVFGDWIMNHREFVVVRIDASNGLRGWAFTLTRDGAVADHIRRTLAPIYLGTEVGRQQQTYHLAWRRSLASHCGGIGLRALSLMDLASWDLAARTCDCSIAAMLDGSASPMPVTAIVGYPPASIGPDQLFEQVRDLAAAGWQRFKAPIAPTWDQSAQRLRAVRRAAPTAWVGCDAAWVFDTAEDAAQFLNQIDDVDLGWFEDVFPPGNARLVRALRERTSVPIAMGDEQGGAYYPHALLDLDAVDVVRVDLTCMGGITGGRAVVDAALAARVSVAPHMFAHVHSQVFAAWGISAPIEWGVPWTGVDPYADSLRQPDVADGCMAPLPQEPGFGPLLNRDWALSQPHDDPDHILEQE